MDDCALLIDSLSGTVFSIGRNISSMSAYAALVAHCAYSLGLKCYELSPVKKNLLLTGAVGHKHLPIAITVL